MSFHPTGFEKKPVGWKKDKAVIYSPKPLNIRNSPNHIADEIPSDKASFFFLVLCASEI